MSALPRLRPAIALLALLAVVLATGCGRGAVRTKLFTVRADSAANRSTPVPVDLVVVFDKKLVDELGALPAREWFAKRAQFSRDHPTGYWVASWELVPGQTLPLQRLPYRRRGARAAFVFADYLERGDHRVRIDPFRAATVVLTADSVTVLQPRRRPSGGAR